MHILIVDDSADERNMYARYLSMKGHRVTKAANGKEGLAKAAKLQPDLVLMDLWLPVLSGWTAMHLLKAGETTSHIPVLIITGRDSVPSPEGDGWLTKPFPLDRLDAEIARIFQVRGGGEGLSHHAG